MKAEFTLIALEDYLERHLRENPSDSRDEVSANLRSAIQAAQHGVRCKCGAPIWIIGSAFSGHGCFTCITGEAVPDSDFEIDVQRVTKDTN
jgi:hypothetical protein